MSVLAPTASQPWDLASHPVTLVRGISPAARSEALHGLARRMIGEGGSVTVIAPTWSDLDPTAHLFTSLQDALPALIAVLDAAEDRSTQQLVIVDRIGALFNMAGAARNAIDALLALLIDAAEHTGICVAVSAAGDFSRVAPMTAFTLRHAAKLTV